MIDHVWTILGSRAVIDKRTNNVSIQNVVEQLTVFGMPDPESRIAIELELVSFWIRSDPNTPAQGRMRLVVVSPSGKCAEPLETELDLTAHERLRVPIRFESFPCDEAGRYYFRVELLEKGDQEWRDVAAVPLTLVFKPEAEKLQPED